MAIGKENNNVNFDDEEDGVCDSTAKEAAYPVVGVVVTDRKIRFHALKDLLASIWRPGKGVSIKEIDNKRYSLRPPKFGTEGCGVVFKKKCNCVVDIELIKCK
ncbi:unnamed protein product [Cuscuta epithymum]|uniref:DUF4283 domain-containing protein n=1 Tax=Cuscuta epithymum TaxID=186058 RepID=A0AAV0E9N0_9ASTE|nr:unnamed protein product [Cuscuta epithymum]